MTLTQRSIAAYSPLVAISDNNQGSFFLRIWKNNGADPTGLTPNTQYAFNTTYTKGGVDNVVRLTTTTDSNGNVFADVPWTTLYGTLGAPTSGHPAVVDSTIKLAGAASAATLVDGLKARAVGDLTA